MGKSEMLFLPSLSPRQPAWQVLVAAAMTLAITSRVDAKPQDQSDNAADVASLEGETVDVLLKSGVEYDSVEVDRVTTHTQTGEPLRLIGQVEGKQRRAFTFKTIDTVTHRGKVVFSHAAAGDSARAKADGQESKEGTAEDQAAKQHELWLARLRARGVKPWLPLTAEEHAAAIEAHKQRYQEVAKRLPTLQLYETKHFLFCSNLPPQQVRIFVESLDNMYRWMQHLYGVDPEQPVWRGKASVFAFARKEEFVAFEKEFMKKDSTGFAMGLCHHDWERNVCVACYTGDDPDYFATVLVHETSHGFIFCYQTRVQVPSWVNEGMAEVIASKMVPSSKGVQRKEELFIKSMMESPQPRLGESFFVTDQNIPADRYGSATSMTRFLIQNDQAKYVQFIRLLKEGMHWEEALQSSYRANKQQLVAAYGRWIGVPQLMP